VRDVAHMVVTYHQAAEEVMFLVRRWGFDVVPKALRLFAAGKQTAAVIPALTGLSVTAYDAAFTADLKTRLAPYQGTFFVRPSDFSDVEALRDRLRAQPTDERAKGLMAMALIRAKQGEAAQKLLAGVTPASAGQHAPELALAAAELALAHKDRATARFFLEALLEIHGDGFDARLLLGKLAADEGKLDEARRELARAAQFDPDSAEPYLVLGKALLPSDAAAGLAALEKAAALDVMDGSIPKTLVLEYAKRSRWADVVRTARLSQFIDPYDVGVHTALARALAALGHGTEARAEIDLALQCDVSDEQRARLTALRSGSRAGAPRPTRPR
jgi:tetratricopeptide (TPR) repeat protein